MKQVSIVAPTDSTVLLHGETGTGKEFARVESLQEAAYEAAAGYEPAPQELPQDDLSQSRIIGAIQHANNY
ncbi:MAG: sigma 54-interacting transcriptional regulator [Bryobacteraceae bacterium]